MSKFSLKDVESVQGWLETDEIFFLSNLAQQYSSNDIVELGSYFGRSTLALIHGTRAQKKVISVDTFAGADEHQPGEPFFNQETQSSSGGVYIYPSFIKTLTKFDVVNCVDIRKMTSLAAAQHYIGEISLLFVDADHSYEAVRSDIIHWSPFVEIGGIIALHDVGDWSGPTRIAGEMLATGFERLDQVGTLLALRKTCNG